MTHQFGQKSKQHHTIGLVFGTPAQESQKRVKTKPVHPSCNPSVGNTNLFVCLLLCLLRRTRIMAIARDEGARSGTVAELFRNAHATSGVPGL